MARGGGSTTSDAIVSAQLKNICSLADTQTLEKCTRNLNDSKMEQKRNAEEKLKHKSEPKFERREPRRRYAHVPDSSTMGGMTSLERVERLWNVVC